MKPEAAIRRIDSFGKRFGSSRSHLYLAYHGAFPLALTPDLLYRIWANFQRDIQGKLLNIPWIAVADLLLSNLCDEVGHELYEMDVAVRNELLKRLKEDFRFGEKRINELSNFLLAYVRKDLNSSESDKHDFAQSQRWTALAYKDSEEAARELALAFNQAYQQDRAELVRLAALTETLAQPLEEFEKLLIYARVMGHYARKNFQAVKKQIIDSQIKDILFSVSGIILIIPEEIRKILQENLAPNLLNLLQNSDQNYDKKAFAFTQTETYEEDNKNFQISRTIAKMQKSGVRKLMARVIISTVGITLLNNQINRENSEEKEWFFKLHNTANLTITQISEDVQEIIAILRNRAMNKLIEGTFDTICRSSAELNGIYALYQGQLNRGQQDIHWLIATDTVLGEAVAETISSFLKTQGLIAQVFQPSGFSTASTDSFASGIDELLVWFNNTVIDYKTYGYSICFNLVGGFKSLHTYMTTIAMLYADETLILFEGINSQILTIPQIPIQIDTSLIKPVEFALMAQGAELKISDIKEDIPKIFLFVVDQEVILSNWGRLVWNQCKKDLLCGELLKFPYLKYENSFKDNYQKIINKDEKVKVQETLAKVSYLLMKSKGDSYLLKQDEGLGFQKFAMKDIYMFRVGLTMRVSCQFESGYLLLQTYGGHE